MSSLLRSTKFVRYFTGAARTLILNSSKTAEINLLTNTKALCVANNILLRDYATSKKAESLEPLLQKLDSEVRRFGRITKRDIDEVFDEIQGKNDITSSQSLLVIRCCGELVPEELPEQRTLLVQKIWSVLTERKIPMDISHYNALLRVYLENEHPFSPAQFLEELEMKGLQPNRVTYQRLMWRYCQEGDVVGATKVLEKMRELNMPVSEPVLNALVMGHAFHGDTEGAQAVLETMAGAGLEPSNRTYMLLACGHAKNGDIERIESVIKTAMDKDAYMSDKDILDIIEHLTIAGHGDKVEKLFHHLQNGFGYNQEACNVILKLINKGHDKTAKLIMKTMPKSPNVADTPFKGAFFVKQLLKVNKPVDNVIKICRELQDEKLVPSALFIAAEGALQLGHCEMAQKLFTELKKDGLEIRQHYYWPLLAQKGRGGDEEGLLQIIRNMNNEGISLSGEGLRDYVIPYLIKNDSPQNVIVKLQIANVPTILCARNLMVDLLESGKIKEAADIALKYQPRGQYSLVARSLINALTKTKNIDSFATILHVTSSQTIQNEEDDSQKDDNMNSIEIGRIVKSAIKNLSKPELCEQLLSAVYSKGLRISTEAAEEIEQFFGQNMTSSLSQLLSELTSPDLELAPLDSPKRDQSEPRNSAQLERILEQRKAKGENVNRIQKQLISMYVKENNVEKLNNLITELDATNFEISTAIYAQLYEFYCQIDQIEKAKECEEKIIAKNPDFQLNNYKLINMAYALVRANRFEEAVQFLKGRKPLRDEVENNSFMINSKTWQMLNHLAEQKDDEKVNILTKLLIDNNHVAPCNVILGPSIKVHLLKDDLEGALAAFENCCKQYRSTPWKGELMKTLIMKEDASKLQWVADLSTQIHGEVNILHDLVLAFIECGRLRQARRILETPGLQTRHRRLQDACQRYVEEGKSEYLEGLLEATKELSHIDRSRIFYQLLVTYCKADETDKALGLWTILQEEDEVPSDQFLIHLGQHLKEKNKEVPFIIPKDQSTLPTQRNIVEKIISPKELPRTSKNEVTNKVESLIKEGNIHAALDYSINMIDKGIMPKPNVLKFLLRNLAEAAEVEKIQLLGKYITENTKKNITYDDKLTLAIFNRGAGSHHVDTLYDNVQVANSEEDLDQILKKFPRSSALSKVVINTELAEKCQKVAELAASKGYFMPANLLWMEYVLADMEKEANSIWDKCLTNTNSIVFRRLLQESHTRKEPKYTEKLINMLESNSKFSKGSLGNAYSRLIDLHLLMNNIEKAKATTEKAIKQGLTMEQLNKNCIDRLKSELDKSGQSIVIPSN